MSTGRTIASPCGKSDGKGLLKEDAIDERGVCIVAIGGARRRKKASFMFTSAYARRPNDRIGCSATIRFRPASIGLQGVFAQKQKYAWMEGMR